MMKEIIKIDKATLCNNCGFLINDKNPFCLCHIVIQKMKQEKNKYFWKIWKGCYEKEKH